MEKEKNTKPALKHARAIAVTAARLRWRGFRGESLSGFATRSASKSSASCRTLYAASTSKGALGSMPGSRLQELRLALEITSRQLAFCFSR